MKTIKLLTLLSFLTLGVTAQNCFRSGTFISAGDVNLVGAVTVEEQDNGELHIKLGADFVADAGPDLDVYLGNTDRVDANSARIKALGSITGAQTYVVPSSINLDDYQYVTIHCTQYNHYWGAAKLGVKEGNCSTLNLVNVSSAKLELNLNSNALTITADQVYENLVLTVYNVQGKLLQQKQINRIEKGDTNFQMQLSKQVIVVLTSSKWNLSKQFYLNK